MSKQLWTISVLVVLSGIYCMSRFLSAATRTMSTVSSKYVEGTFSMAFVTAPDEEHAKQLAKGLVENKLAACVNIIPAVKSIYEWEGKINEDNELILIQNGNAPYLDWLAKVIPPK